VPAPIEIANAAVSAAHVPNLFGFRMAIPPTTYGHSFAQQED
jgi:hypothetical protein